MDFYSGMLTEKQRDVLELYYNEDLSLSEIAEHEKITRQGVRDSIKRGEDTLLELEDKLGMAKKLLELSALLDDVKTSAELIYNESSTYNFSKVITINAETIIQKINDSADLL